MSYFSCTSPVQILQSPLNDSKAKYHYSFSKSHRFQRYKTNCQQAHYQHQSQLSKVSAKIGNGQRSDFTKTTSVAPAPTQYQIASKFEKNLANNRGQTFGLSRDFMKETGHILQGIQSYPGVGQYNQGSQKTKIGYSIRPKTANRWLPTFLKEENNLFHPGPGNYNYQDLDMNKFGKSVNARYKSVPATTVSKQQRFQQYGLKTPGPCQYTYQDTINDSGKYTSSWNRGNGKRLIGKEKRKSFIDKSVEKSYGPGPGQYRQPSDFGHYDNLEITNQSFYRRPKTASVS